MLAYVYFLRCQKTGRLYIGSTINLQRRIKQHKNSQTYTTKRFHNPQLVFVQEYDKLDDARKIERKLKKLKRKDYLESIIREGIIRMSA